MSEHCNNITALNMWAHLPRWSATLHAVRTTRTGADLQVQKMDVNDQGAQMEPLLPAVRRSLISRGNAAVHGICPIRDRVIWLNACVRDLEFDWMTYAPARFAHLQFEGDTRVTVAFCCSACCRSGWISLTRSQVHRRLAGLTENVCTDMQDALNVITRHLDGKVDSCHEWTQANSHVRRNQHEENWRLDCIFQDNQAYISCQILITVIWENKCYLNLKVFILYIMIIFDGLSLIC